MGWPGDGIGDTPSEVACIGRDRYNALPLLNFIGYTVLSAGKKNSVSNAGDVLPLLTSYALLV